MPKGTENKRSNAKVGGSNISNDLRSLRLEISMLKKREERIGAMLDILRWFDFQKVADVCKYLDWKVYDFDAKGLVPVTVGILIRSFEEMARSCWEAFDEGKANEEWTIHTGPLKLWWYEGEDGVLAELDFVGESWRYEPEC